MRERSLSVNGHYEFYEKTLQLRRYDNCVTQRPQCDCELGHALAPCTLFSRGTYHVFDVQVTVHRDKFL